MAVAVDQRAPSPVPWWLVLLEGILAVILGGFLLVRPGITFTLLVQVIAIYWLVDGIFRIISIFMDSSQWGWKLFTGVIGILAGLVLFGEGFLGAVLFGTSVIWIMGILGIVYGVLGIFQSFSGAGWGSLVLGILSIIVGIILLGNTLIAAAMLPWILAGFLIAGGILAIISAFQLR